MSNWLTRLFARKTNARSSSDAALKELDLLYKQRSGKRRPLTAGDTGWVFAANRQVAGRAVKASMDLFRVSRTDRPGGTPEEFKETKIIAHPVLDLLRSPNKDETGLVFRWKQILHLQTSGIVYVAAFPHSFTMTMGGKQLTMSRIQELRLIAGARMKTESGDDRIIGKMIFSKKDGSDEEFRPAPRSDAEIAEWRQDPYPFAFPIAFPGLEISASPAKAGATAISSLAALGDLNANQLENGIHAGLIFYLLTTSEDPERFELAMMLLKAGIGKAGEPIFLPKNRIEVEKSPITNADMQFKELAEISRQEALAVMGASDGMVGMSSNLNRATIWGQEHNMAVGTVDPLNDLIADAYNAFLIPIYPGQSPTNKLVLRFASAKLVDPKDSATVHKMYVESGILTSNDVRAEIGKDAHPDGDKLKGFSTSSTPEAPIPAGQKPPAAEPEDDDPDEGRTLAPFVNLDDVFKMPPPDLTTDEGRAAEWTRIMRSFEDIESAFERGVSDLFAEMEQDILRKLSAWGSDLFGDDIGRTRGERQSDALGAFFNPEEWSEQYRQLYSEHALGAIADGAKGVFADLGLEAIFKVTDPRVAAFVSSSSFQSGVAINETTAKVLSDLLADAFAEGIGPIAFRTRIEKVFEGFKGARSVTIARTEMNSASNWARDQAMIDSKAMGVKLKKMWASARDVLVRETHVRANGQTREIEDAFDVGSCKMMHPMDGDLCADASEIVNCRCRSFAIPL